MRYWLSWEQPTIDFRPIWNPPKLPVLGWWCSGYTANDNAIIYAAVDAVSEEEAWRIMKDYWPEVSPGLYRFIVEQREPNWVPGDRFQKCRSSLPMDKTIYMYAENAEEVIEILRQSCKDTGSKMFRIDIKVTLEPEEGPLP
jgi:hypothetical protein